MKNLIFVLSLLLALPLNATVFSQRINLNSTNLGASFASGAANHMTFNNATINAIDTVMIDNQQSGEIVVNCTQTGSTVPADTVAGNIYVAALEAWSLPDKTGFGNNCYVRSFSGTLATGIVVITAVGR